jgi:hypothetical protein
MLVRRSPDKYPTARDDGLTLVLRWFAVLAFNVPALDYCEPAQLAEDTSDLH